MIFDNHKAEELLETYTTSGDRTALIELHEEAGSLIEVMASSINGCPRNDLIQVGHEKLQELVSNGRFSPERGSLHSFLTISLRHSMLDFAGWFSVESSVDGVEGVSHNSYLGDVGVFDGIPHFSSERFPSLDKMVAVESSCYVVSAVCEQVREGHRGIIRTLTTIYPMERDVGTVVYHSVVALMRMEMSGIRWQDNISDALKIVFSGGEKSLVPEMCLLVGREMSELVGTVFRGAYVKF